MQYPGTSPSGTFGGATALTDQLRPNSLAQRKQQLIAKLASGQSSHAAFPGSGGAGLGQMGDQNSFLASLFSNMGGGGDGQFYGNGGSPSPQQPSAAPPPAAPVGPISTGADSSAATSGVPAAAPAVSPTASGMGGILGGTNPLRYMDLSWLANFNPQNNIMNTGMRINA